MNGMITGRGKVVATISGAMVVGILLTVAALWKDFAVRYHLHRLRSTPDYFFEITDRPEGSAGRVAVESFARSDQGAKLLLSTILRHLRGGVSSPGLREVDMGIMGFGDGALKTDQSPVSSNCITFRKSTQPGKNIEADVLSTSIETHVLSLLAKVPGHDHILPDYPGFRFTVLTADSASDRIGEASRQRLGTSLSWKAGPKEFPFVILVQRDVRLRDF